MCVNDVIFIQPEPRGVRERVATVHNENFSLLFERLYETNLFETWHAHLCITTDGANRIAEGHCFNWGLCLDESEIVTFFAQFIAQRLARDERLCFVALERFIRTAKVPFKKRGLVVQRVDDYLYMCVGVPDLELIEDFLCTTTFQQNFFMLTRRCDTPDVSQDLGLLCDYWIEHAELVVLSVLDDETYLVFSKDESLA